MINRIHKLSIIRVFAFALIAVFGMTTLAVADNKQKNKRSKKNDVFINNSPGRF